MNLGLMHVETNTALFFIHVRESFNAYSICKYSFLSVYYIFLSRFLKVVRQILDLNQSAGMSIIS